MSLRRTAAAQRRNTRSTTRRTTTALAVGAAAALALAACSDAEGEDSGDGEVEIDSVEIIVPADPGGGWDQTGRTMQSEMQDNDIVGDAQVVNVGGAGGTVGLAQLATATNENTLMVMGYVMVGAIETNQSETTLEDVTPIARLTEEPLVVVVPAESEYETIQDLTDDIIANGQDVSVTGGSAGGVDHILAAQLLTEAGMDPADVAGALNYIPYSGGGESLAALLGNNVDAGISGVAEYAEQVNAGTLRALAVSSEEPSPALPDTPTLIDQDVDLVLTNWRGVVAPGNIDDAQAEALTQLVTEMHDADSWADALEANNWDDAFLAGDEFATFLEEDIESVRQTLTDIGLV
ncbi:Bug family tripartite tricarboxylate transporter substrate binding protein [Georgenia sp. Z1344]|uniref:Bug family tripartite tricarboxylate transporter substrate binding protein n=1 Tax=Georgenia sp. Z1344 TaxID=3416706 RepID=UPI003CF014A6